MEFAAAQDHSGTQTTDVFDAFDASDVAHAPAEGW